jgi:hypothetical protein
VRPNNFDEHQKRFVKLAEELSYGRSNVFRDFCEVAAISLANVFPGPDRDAREARYEVIRKQYKPEELSKLAEMLSCVVNSFSGKDGGFHFQDCLGELHMADEITGKSKWDSDVAFTPFHVAKLMAQMTFTDVTMPKKGYIALAEPASGSGGLVIAACAAFQELGFNFQTQLHVTATEIRSMVAHMAYIQLSLLHVPAIVIHGDSLSKEVWSVWKTPAHLLGFWDARLARDRAAEAAAHPPPPTPPKVNKKGQGLFDF